MVAVVQEWLGVWGVFQALLGYGGLSGLPCYLPRLM